MKQFRWRDRIVTYHILDKLRFLNRFMSTPTQYQTNPIYFFDQNAWVPSIPYYIFVMNKIVFNSNVSLSCKADFGHGRRKLFVSAIGCPHDTAKSKAQHFFNFNESKLILFLFFIFKRENVLFFLAITGKRTW